MCNLTATKSISKMENSEVIHSTEKRLFTAINTPPPRFCNLSLLYTLKLSGNISDDRTFVLSQVSVRSITSAVLLMQLVNTSGIFVLMPLTFWYKILIFSE